MAGAHGMGPNRKSAALGSTELMVYLGAYDKMNWGGIKQSLHLVVW
jgi:hypothetical protein